jgi:hypothetical protein
MMMAENTPQTISIVNQTTPAVRDLQIAIFQQNLAAPDMPLIPWKVVKPDPGPNATVVPVPSHYVIYAEIAGNTGGYQSNRIILNGSTAVLNLRRVMASERNEETIILDLVWHGVKGSDQEPIRVGVDYSIDQIVKVHLLKDNADLVAPIEIHPGETALFQPQHHFYLALVGENRHSDEWLQIDNAPEIQPEQKAVITGNREKGLNFSVMNYEYNRV